MEWNIKKSEPKVNLTVRVNPNDLKALDDILEQQGITRSTFLQSVISQYIEEAGKALREKESVVMYLHDGTLSEVESDVTVLVDVVVASDDRLQITALDMAGNGYKAVQTRVDGVYNVESKGIEELSRILEKFERTEKELKNAIGCIDRTKYEIDDLKEKAKFIAVAYINVYINSGALLRKISDADGIEPLTSLDITEIMETLTNLVNITEKPILESQELFEKYRNEHFRLYEIYRGLSRCLGINKRNSNNV